MGIKTRTLFFLVFSFSVLRAQTWRPLGPIGSDQYNLKHSAWGGGTGQVHGFAFVPRGDDSGKYDWYCTSPFGGLWKSIDEGAHWIDFSPQLEQVAGLRSCLGITGVPHDPLAIYVSTGQWNRANKLDAPGAPCTGVFRSADGGKTFQRTGLKFNFEDNDHITHLSVNPSSNGGGLQLFASTSKGLYMSQSDPDKKWTKVLDDDKLFTVEVSPNYFQTLSVYASGDDIYVSKKGGAKNSFSPMSPSVLDLLPAVKTARNISICIGNRNGKDVIYALVYQDGADYFAYYDGSKWEMRKPPVVVGTYIPTEDRMKLCVNPTNPDNVYVGITYVSRTDDGGKTWQLAGKYCQPGSQNDSINIHGDIHAVSFIPGTNDILIGTDGGIFRYLAAERKEIELNNGLNISQVMGMSAPAQAPHKIMIGKQDTGYDLYDGSEWTNFLGGDGYAVHASPTDSTIYLCHYGYRMVAKGKRANPGRPTGCKASEDALFSSVVFDPKFPDRCFIGGTNISYTNDSAKTFTTIYKYHSAVGQPVDFETQIEAMAVGHDEATGESVVYATNYGFSNGGVCKMVKGRINITKTSGKPCDENLCSSCWAKVPLPNEKMEWLDNTSYSVSGIAVSPSDPDELWISFEHNSLDKDDLKVLHSTDGGASWSDMDRGLPRYTICTTIRYDEKTKFLYLGTSIGVYINRNDSSGWKPFDQSLPKCYVKVLEIQEGIGKIRAGLYGGGVWEADLAK